MKYSVKIQTASTYTRDGIRLDADIYYPQTQERLPVLLMRQPYGRSIASTVVYAHPNWYASHGYIVVIQDVRGRGTSTGEFELFLSEQEDGFDTIEWAAQLPGSTGDVGMYGFSYQGMTQLYAAATKPPALKTICPAMIAYDLYADWAYEHGIFCLESNLSWAVQLAAETARLKEDVTAYQTLYKASKNLPLYDSVSFFSESLRKYTPSNFYHQWLNHPQPDSYWEKLSPAGYLGGVDLPMLHIGGWWDGHLRGNLKLYDHMTRVSQYPQHLVIGPWQHLFWGRRVAQMNYGPAAISPIDELQLAWFDYFLKGIDSPLLQQPPIRLFQMGSNQWVYYDKFPCAQGISYYFSTNELATIREDGGKLVLESEGVAKDVLVHDPWRPVPSIGGHSGSNTGAYERSNLDVRTDILTYTSPPLSQDWTIVGNIRIELNCSSNALTFELHGVLSEVKPDGRVYNFTQGCVRCKGDSGLKVIPLQPTSIVIPQDSCVRLSLSGSYFPAYQLHKNNQIITIEVVCGGDQPSRVVFG